MHGVLGRGTAPARGQTHEASGPRAPSGTDKGPESALIPRSPRPCLQWTLEPTDKDMSQLSPPQGKLRDWTFDFGAQRTAPLAEFHLLDPYQKCSFEGSVLIIDVLILRTLHHPAASPKYVLVEPYLDCKITFEVWRGRGVTYLQGSAVRVCHLGFPWC